MTLQKLTGILALAQLDITGGYSVPPRHQQRVIKCTPNDMFLVVTKTIRKYQLN